VQRDAEAGGDTGGRRAGLVAKARERIGRGLESGQTCVAGQNFGRDQPIGMGVFGGEGELPGLAESAATPAEPDAARRTGRTPRSAGAKRPGYRGRWNDGWSRVLPGFVAERVERQGALAATEPDAGAQPAVPDAARARGRAGRGPSRLRLQIEPRAGAPKPRTRVEAKLESVERLGARHGLRTDEAAGVVAPGECSAHTAGIGEQAQSPLGPPLAARSKGERLTPARGLRREREPVTAAPRHSIGKATRGGASVLCARPARDECSSRERQPEFSLVERTAARALERGSVIAPGDGPRARRREPAVARRPSGEGDGMRGAGQRDVGRHTGERRGRRARRNRCRAGDESALQVERSHEQAGASAAPDGRRHAMLIPQPALPGIARGGDSEIGEPRARTRRAKGDRGRGAEPRLAVGSPADRGAPRQLGRHVRRVVS
jgi:hypothetical protein